MRPSPRNCTLLLCAAAVVAAACGRSPVIRYYTLRPTAETRAPKPGLDALAVAVGPLELPRYLDRPEIVWRSGPSRLEFDEVHRWADDLESELLRVLGEDLAAILGTKRVVVYPADAPFPLDYRIVLDIQQFDADREGDLILRARWFVRSGGKNDLVALEGSEIRQPVVPEDTEGLVRASSKAIGELSRDIARTLRRLEKERSAAAAQPSPADAAPDGSGPDSPEAISTTTGSE